MRGCVDFISVKVPVGHPNPPMGKRTSTHLQAARLNANARTFCARPCPPQGPLQPLAEAIRATLNGAGEALEKLGQRTLGGHILAFVEARKAAG